MRQIQLLANIQFPWDTPRCMRTPTMPQASSPQPPVIPGTPPLPILCKFPHQYISRYHLKSHHRNDILAFSPSPKPSQTSSTHASPEPSATPEPGCCQATPVFSQLRDKWCCSACNKDFRGKWECQRHIKTAGKRSKCVACGRNLSARDDSLLRHFTIHCKGNVSNLRLEDAFTSV